MTLPRKVQEQLDAANALQQQLSNPPADNPAPAPEPTPEPVAVEPAPQAEPTPAPAPVPNDEYARLMQQHRSLQGVHRSLEDRARQATAENQRLAQRLDELERQRAAAPVAPPVDHRDSEVFGEDLVGMVNRVADTTATRVAQILEQRIVALENRLQGTTQAVAQTAEEVFLSRLKDAVPDFMAINQDQGFLQWLTEEDPISGIPYQTMLDNASKRLDVERTAKVFLAYKKLSAPAPAPVAPGKPTAQSQLERQIAPSTAAAPAPSAKTQASYLLMKDVEAFYREVAQGKYKGREELAAQIEATINNAMAANRIFEHPPRQPV